MNTWFRRNSALLLALVGIGIGLAASFQAAALSRKPATPTSVAVVDWFAVTDKVDEWKEMQAELNKLRDSLLEQDSKTQKALAELRESVTVLPEGSDTRRREEEKYVIQKLQYEAWKQFRDNKMQTEQARMQVRLYNRITAAVAKVAQRDGWSIILWDDSRTKTPVEGKLDEAAELISRRQVLYSRQDAVDITDEIVLLMNNEFNAGP